MGDRSAEVKNGNDKGTRSPIKTSFVIDEPPMLKTSESPDLGSSPRKLKN